MLRELEGDFCPRSGPSSRPDVWLLHPSGPSEGEAPRFWGLSPEERLRRSLARATAKKPIASGSTLGFRGDYVYDEKLVGALLEQPGVVLLDPATTPPTPVAVHGSATQREQLAAWLNSGTIPESAGLRALRPEQLATAFDAALRKVETPLLIQVGTEQVENIEAQLFEASYKGVTDFVTKWLWPHPARATTRWLARRGVAPNVVTLTSGLLVVVATWAFANGRWAPGLIAAWAMTFLDTVDGKLARVTLRSSRLGHLFDHGLDLVHPPFWYAAWAHGLGGGAPWLPAATSIVVGGYVLGRILEGVFLLAFGIETHAWRRLDSRFRTVTARRNPNLALLSIGALGGRPDLGFAAVACWTLFSLGFHGVRLCQAARCQQRGERIRPWFESGAL